ncbi:hypothetical protein QBC35DRAFT_460791 [Podospora australis]|uniref:Uncharacterized protein n=1 Tax=Podospora australis TaxID=1536484 RepID=A0AAN6WZ19_9PEZI|nr:hypothetical protein QBC35DRAFT_460791 [Podospora australis]
MQRLFCSTVAVLLLSVASVRAAEVVYITDLSIYSDLAPCAQSAIRYNVQSQTYDKCPAAVTGLQSCVCTKNNNMASISAQLSTSISYSCGATASEDQSSAQVVLNAYCNQATTAAFPAPTAVSVYLTDIPEVDYLAPCAKSALRYAMSSMTYAKCPSAAPALASCVCKKNQNSLLVSQIINSSAKYSCSGLTADVSSAQAMFSAYCGLNAGTSNFPKPSNPPGDMSYYITDLPQYSSLAPCAASAIRYVINSQTYALCPNGPQALASCVCLKDGMTAGILKELTSSVKYSCASTASEDIKSAVDVYNYYCSAARSEVVAAGVTNSIEQPYPPAGSGGGGGGGSGPRPTGGPGGGGSGGNGSGNGGSNSSGSSNGGADGSDPQSGSKTNIGMIVGIAAGAVGGLAILGAIIFFLVKSSKKRREREQLGEELFSGPGTGMEQKPVPVPGEFYKPGMMASDAVPAPPPASPSPSMLKVHTPPRADTVSPASAHGSAFSPPLNQSELSGQTAALYPPMPNTSELHSQHSTPAQGRVSPFVASPASPNPQTPGQAFSSYGSPPPHAPELYGQGAPSPNRPELQGQGAMYPPHPQNSSELQGQGSHFTNANPNRPELQGQGAMVAPPPDRPELQGQGSHFTSANPNRPELQGQSAMFAPAPDRPELQGQGTPFHDANPNRPELAGQFPQHQYPSYRQGGAPSPQLQGQGPPQFPGGQPQMGQGQVYQAYNSSPVPQQQQYQPQQGPTELQPVSWQSGPVPGVHEMDGFGRRR